VTSRGVIGLLLVVAVAASCGDDASNRVSSAAKRSRPATTTTTAPDRRDSPAPTLFRATSTTMARSVFGSTPTTSPATQPTANVAEPPERAADVGDYEGQLYDFGQITAVQRRAAGVVVVFNRMQLYMDDGSLRSGTDFNEEPIVYGNTDVPYVDESSKSRTFVLAPDAVVVRLADPLPCFYDEHPTDPVWNPIPVAELLSGSWKDRTQDTLSFRQDGLVSQVRLSAAC